MTQSLHHELNGHTLSPVIDKSTWQIHISISQNRLAANCLSDKAQTPSIKFTLASWDNPFALDLPQQQTFQPTSLLWEHCAYQYSLQIVAHTNRIAWWNKFHKLHLRWYQICLYICKIHHRMQQPTLDINLKQLLMHLHVRLTRTLAPSTGIVAPTTCTVPTDTYTVATDTCTVAPSTSTAPSPTCKHAP